MDLLQQAKKLVEEKTDYTMDDFLELMRLRDQATGEECYLIGDMVEAFLKKAPLNVMMQITGMTKD